MFCFFPCKCLFKICIFFIHQSYKNGFRGIIHYYFILDPGPGPDAGPNAWRQVRPSSLFVYIALALAKVEAFSFRFTTFLGAFEESCFEILQTPTTTPRKTKKRKRLCSASKRIKRSLINVGALIAKHWSNNYQVASTNIVSPDSAWRDAEMALFLLWR